MMRSIARLLITLAVIVLPDFSPAEENSPVKIDFNQRIEMRDGVELSADIYRPDEEGRLFNKEAYTQQKLLNHGKYRLQARYPGR